MHETLRRLAASLDESGHHWDLGRSEPLGKQMYTPRRWWLGLGIAAFLAATPPSSGAPGTNSAKRFVESATAAAHFNLRQSSSPGRYRMAIGGAKSPSRVTIYIQQNPKTGKLEHLFVDNALFSLSYLRRSPFGVPDVVVHTGKAKWERGQPNMRLWEDVGIRGRFLLRRVGTQKQAYIGGRWVSAAVLTDGHVVYAGKTYTYDKRLAEFVLAPQTRTRPTSRPGIRKGKVASPTAVGTQAGGWVEVEKPFLRVGFLTSGLTYGGVVGRTPALQQVTARPKFGPTSTAPSIRVFLAAPGGATSYSPRSTEQRSLLSVGGPVVRWLGKSRGALGFSQDGLKLFRRAPNGRLKMRWILRLSGKEAFLPYKRLWCALNPTRTLAAFVAVQLVPPRWVLHVVNTTNGAGAALQLPHQPTGIAFRGQQILVSVRRNRPRFDECLAVALSSEAGGEHLAATKRFAVPGKLVGVAGIYPVFESQFGNELFMHGRYLQLQREKILRVLCSHGKVVVVTDSGAVWLWGRGKARRLFRAGEPVIGSGQWKGDFWLVESSGRADLISPTGQVQHAQLRLPAPR